MDSTWESANEPNRWIHCGDETGRCSDDVRGRGYAPKGETPVLRIKAKRSSLSVISTVTNKGRMRWRIFSGALDARILIDFRERLTRNAAKKMLLIIDDLRVHHAKVVQQWLVKNVDKIEVFYLPSYSPELNPGELLNADLKQHVTTAAPAKTKI
jgi:transposase